MQQSENQFASRWFDNAPFAMLLQDGSGRVTWANRALERLVGLPSSQFLGHDSTSLPSAEHRPLLGDAELVEVGGPATPRCWLRRRVHQDSGTDRLHVFQDITREQLLAEENNRLRRQVEELKLTDDLTGLPNKRAISQALEAQISRSRRYQNPLSVIMAMVTLGNNLDNLPYQGDQVHLSVSRFLRDRLRWVDQIGRWDDNVFVLVLPETAAEDAAVLADKILNEVDSIVLPEALQDGSVTLRLGRAAWGKGDDMRTLLRAVLDDLKSDA